MTAPATDEAADNFTRLSSHLKEGTLAARLVAAYIAAPAGEGDAALKVLMKERLNEIAQTYVSADH